MKADYYEVQGTPIDDINPASPNIYFFLQQIPRSGYVWSCRIYIINSVTEAALLLRLEEGEEETTGRVWPRDLQGWTGSGTFANPPCLWGLKTTYKHELPMPWLSGTIRGLCQPSS